MNAPILLLYGVLGLVGGAIYFAVLRFSLGLPGWRLVAAAAAARLATAGLLFWLAAQGGAGPLLAALAGFLAARAIALRWVRSLPP